MLGKNEPGDDEVGAAAETLEDVVKGWLLKEARAKANCLWAYSLGNRKRCRRPRLLPVRAKGEKGG